MKFFWWFILGVSILTGIFWYNTVTAKEEKMQQDIAKEVIRLHVIANSDKKEDQELKLQVKEKIVELLRGYLSEERTVEGAREVLRKHLGEVEKCATDYIKSCGFEYEVNAELGNCYFPIKKYGDMTFPAGEYEALRVHIGKSTGRNWWCVMYPSLCFVDSVGETVPEESKAKLKDHLTEEEYESLLDGENVEYGFFLWDYFKDLFAS